MARILIVDDDPDFRAMVINALTYDNHVAVEAGNGIKALQLLENDEFDIIMTDVIMPDMGGIELIQELRRKDPGARIIAFSGGAFHSGAGGYLTVCRTLGVKWTLSKPFPLSELMVALDEALGEPA